MRLTVMTSLILWLLALTGLPAEESAARLLAINTATRTVHVQSFIDQADHLSPAERESLINKLIQLNMPSAIPSLEKLLETTSQKEREIIINHFCAYNHDVAVTALINACTSTNNDVRAYTWEQIKDSYNFHNTFAGNKKLRAFLVTILRDANSAYRGNAAYALINLGIKKEVDEAEDYLLTILPKTWSDEDYYIINMLAKRGDKRLFPVLCDVLKMDVDTVGKNRHVEAVRNIAHAIQAGATFNDELRKILVNTVQHSPYYSPASFAASFLGAIKDQKSYDGLLAALETTEASEPVFNALWQINPERAIADCELILRNNKENESYSIYLYGKKEDRLIPLFEKFAAVPFSPTDHIANQNRRQSIMSLYEALFRNLNSNIVDKNERLKRFRYLERYLNDPDEELENYVLKLWSSVTEEEIPKTQVERIIQYFDSNDQRKRDMVFSVMSSNAPQFEKQLLKALTMDLEDYHRIWIINGLCERRGDLPEKQLTEIVIKELQSNKNFTWLKDIVSALVKNSKEPLQLSQQFFDIYAGLQEETQKQIMNGLLQGADIQFLYWMATRWNALADDVKKMFLNCLSEWSEKPLQINSLATILEDSAKQSNPLQSLAIQVLSIHTITNAQKFDPSRVIHGGLEALRNISSKAYDSYDAPFDVLRKKLVQFTGRYLEGSPDFKTVIDLLLSGTCEARRTGCVAAQLMGQCGALYKDQYDKKHVDKMQRILQELVKDDSPYIRKEALRALGWFEDVYSFNQLAELFHVDPVLQTTIIPLMQSLDYQRTERFLFEHYEMIYVSDSYKHRPIFRVDEGGVYFNGHSQ